MAVRSYTDPDLYNQADLELMTSVSDHIAMVVERKRAEDALRRERDRAQRYLDVAASMLIALDAEGRITLINRKGCQLLGYTEDELIGRNWLETCIPESQRKQMKSTFAQLMSMNPKAVEYFENSVRAKSGQERIIAWFNTILYDDSGNIKGTLSSGVDITENKRAEEALRASEVRYRTLFESANDAIFLMDGERFIDCNPTTLSIYGCTRDQIVGTSPSKFSPEFQPDGRDSLTASREKIDQALSGEPQFFEWLHCTHDGTLFDAEVSLNRIELSGKKFVQAIVRDVTERKRLEERLRQAQKMESVGQLAGGIAHDFNNLLGGIIGFTELLRDNAGDAGMVSSFASEILDTSQRAADLIAQLLAFSRQGRTQSSSVDLHEVIEKTVKLLQHSIDRKIEIRRELTDVPATTIGDPSQLQSAVLNLAVNARDAMPDGGVLTIGSEVVRLDMEFCRNHSQPLEPGVYVEIFVTDTGIGMSHDVQTQIFEPFFTTKDVGKGTGLGLSAVYGITKDHNGAISVYSEPGRGSTFKLHLPLAGGVAAPVKEREPAAVASGRGCILLVDDEAIIRKVAGGMLQDMGYQVITADNGEEAVAKYRDLGGTIDLVIIDMVMPKMNGQETIEELRKLDPDVKVMISSGFSLGVGGREFSDVAIQGFVQKPYRKQALSEKVAEALRTT